MRFGRRHWLLVATLLALVVGGARYLAAMRAGVPADAEDVGRAARIRPDYSGTVIPPNIAPLDFRVAEEGDRYCVQVSAGDGPSIVVRSRSPDIVIPQEEWRRLLDASRGRELRFDVHVRQTDGQWLRFSPIVNTIAREPIDAYLMYRLLQPAYRYWKHMELRQRHLESYDESVVVDNSLLDGACVNCHTFASNPAARMAFQFRSGKSGGGIGMVMVDGKHVTNVDTRTEEVTLPSVYMTWHPGGRLIAFSANKVRQFFHSVRSEPRDVVDLESDLAVYSLDSGAVTSTPRIARRDRLETWPAWSPDGRHLYFSSAPMLWGEEPADPATGRYREVRYDLTRIAFNAEDNTWGEPETVLSADETGLSITQPRFSPDGRWLLCTMCEYGCFPIFHPDADIYMLNVESGRARPLAINSAQCDSWHSWSSNGRWFVFSSKRQNGAFARPYFAYVEEDGTVRKPFLLPQKDPRFYDSFLKTYNVPEFAREPVPLSAGQIARAIRTQPWVHVGVPVTGATPGPGSGEESAPDVRPDPWSAPHG